MKVVLDQGAKMPTRGHKTDAGYTGSIQAVLFNHSGKTYIVEKGQKITQLVIFPIITPELEVVASLEETDRGNGGFGSTGKF